MRFKGNGSRRSRLLPFFLCAVRVAVDPSLSVGDACDRLVNGSLPLGVEGEALLLGLGLIGGLQLGNVDIIEVHAQILELGDGIIIGLIEQITLILDALLNGGKERLAKILRDLVPRIVAHAEDDVNEGVAIMKFEDVDVSITGNSTNPTRFQHLVAGTYKKWAIENGKKYFSVASGGGTGRTLHPDNVAAGPASYGLTDSMGRMHGDAQFAGSSSVPAHVEMMGLIGMVGATVACAVAVEEAAK